MIPTTPTQDGPRPRPARRRIDVTRLRADFAARRITHEHFPVGATEEILLLDRCETFEVVASRPDAVHIRVQDGAILHARPRSLARAILDA